MGSSEELRKLVLDTNKPQGRLNTIAEVAFIGLVAYFEAFFKNHFASILNICPDLLCLLKKSGMDVTVDSTDILNVMPNFSGRLGFIVAEKYDFGTAHKINSFYQALLDISPFSKENKRKYDIILSDRNLLVHHSGIYTISYSKQRFAEKKINGLANWQSLVVSKESYTSVSLFFEKIVKKTTKSTKQSLSDYIENNGITLRESQQKAIDLLEMGSK